MFPTFGTGTGATTSGGVNPMFTFANQAQSPFASPYQSAFASMGAQQSPNGAQQPTPGQPTPFQASLNQAAQAYHSPPPLFPQGATPFQSGNPFGASTNPATNPLVNRLTAAALNGGWNNGGAYDPSHNYYADYQARQATGAPGINVNGLLGVSPAAAPTQGQ